MKEETQRSKFLKETLLNKEKSTMILELIIIDRLIEIADDGFSYNEIFKELHSLVNQRNFLLNGDKP